MENNIDLNFIEQELFGKYVDRYEIANEQIQEKTKSLNNQNMIRIVIKLQAYIRMKQQGKFFKDKQKFYQKQQQKKSILQEMYETEKGYVDYLKLLNDLQQQSESEQLLTQLEQEILFINIQTIYCFHLQLMEIIYLLNDQGPKDEHLQDFLNILPGLKIYNDYCQKQDAQNQFLNELMNNENPKFKNTKFYQKFRALERSPELKNLDLESLLIKPCQRIGKYPLLFKDLLKQTEKFESNYPMIQEIINQFKLSITENDLKMVMQDKENMLMYIQSKFKNIDLISNVKRKFIIEKKMNLIISDHQVQQVLCYFLNDAILIENLYDNKDTYQRVNLDKTCFIQQNPKIGLFHNIFYIKYEQGLILNHSDSKDEIKKSKYNQGCLIFQAEDKSSQYQLISYIEKNLDFKIIESSQKTFFKMRGNNSYNHDFIKVKLKIEHYYQILNLNLKVINAIYNQIQKLYFYLKSYQLLIQGDKKEKSQSYLNIFQKIILIMNSDKLKNNNAMTRVLSLFGINEDFYFNNKKEEQLYSQIYPINQYEIDNQIQNQKYTNIQNISKLLLKQRIKNFNKIQDEEQTEIEIYLINEKKYSIACNKNDKIIQVIQILQKKLQIQNILDFKIHIKLKKKFYQVDFDETLENILNLKPKNQQDFFYFMKYLYLDIDYELFQIETNKQQLIVDQLFYQIKNKQILLSESNYLNFLGFNIYLNYGSPKQFDETYIQKLIKTNLDIIPNDIRLIFDQQELIKQTIDNWNIIDQSIETQYQRQYPNVKLKIQHSQIIQKNQKQNTQLNLMAELNNVQKKRLSNPQNEKSKLEQLPLKVQILEQQKNLKSVPKKEEEQQKSQKFENDDTSPINVKQLRQRFEQNQTKTEPLKILLGPKSQNIKQENQNNKEPTIDNVQQKQIEQTQIIDKKKSVVITTYSISNIKLQIANSTILQEILPTIDQYGFKFYEVKINKKNKKNDIPLLNIDLENVMLGIGYRQIRILNDRTENYLQISLKKYYLHQTKESFENNGIDYLLYDSFNFQIDIHLKSGTKRLRFETDQASEIYNNYHEYRKIEKLIKSKLK